MQPKWERNELIRKLKREGKTYRELMKEFDLAMGTLCRIVHGEKTVWRTKDSQLVIDKEFDE